MSNYCFMCQTYHSYLCCPKEEFDYNSLINDKLQYQSINNLFNNMSKTSIRFCNINGCPGHFDGDLSQCMIRPGPGARLGPPGSPTW